MALIELFGHEVVHMILTIVAFVAALLVYVRYVHHKKRGYSAYVYIGLGAFIGEFLLDVDHLYDYIRVFGLNFDIHRFLAGDMFGITNQAYVPLHSWELLVVMAIITHMVKRVRLKYFFLALTIGMGLHLVYDMFFNHFYFLGYSLIYRFMVNFQDRYISLPGD